MSEHGPTLASSMHIAYRPMAASQIIFDARNSVLLRCLQSAGMDTGACILDVGCGRGDMLRLLRANSYTKLFGIDMDDTCAKMASRFGVIQVSTAENLAECFPGTQFDIIICSHVLEHVHNPLGVLGIIASRSVGIIALAVPNALSAGNIVKSFLRIIPSINKGHLQVWDTAHFLNLVATARLKPIMPPTTEYVSFFPYDWVQRMIGERAVLFFRQLDLVGFSLLPKLFPRLGISVVCICRSEIEK